MSARFDKDGLITHEAKEALDWETFYIEKINGVTVAEKYDMLYRTNQDSTKKWAQFVLSPWIGDGSPVAQNMYLDELQVYADSPSSGKNLQAQYQKSKKIETI